MGRGLAILVVFRDALAAFGVAATAPVAVRPRRPTIGVVPDDANALFVIAFGVPATPKSRAAVLVGLGSA
jgi:hypothetical protein